MPDVQIWKVFISLGVPGLALGIMYMLFKKFEWKFPALPKSWVGPILVLFMFLTSGIILTALVLWSPPFSHSSPPFEAKLSDGDIKDKDKPSESISFKGHQPGSPITVVNPSHIEKEMYMNDRRKSDDRR